jgi:hypothetical protein
MTGMAELSFRDRFWSPPVAHAVTSPSAILALGAGAAIGIIATAPVSIPLAIVGAVFGGLLGYGGRVALAIPRVKSAGDIDPFAVNEPWRHAVKDALQAKRRFTEAMANFRDGPLKDSVTTVGGRLDDAVHECWRIAQQGQLVADARKRIDDREVTWELQRQASLIAPGSQASETQSRTIESLKSQLATAQRMDQLIASTRDELDLINARLDESVTQAIELSVSNRSDGLDPLGADVDAIVDDLESLRQAMGDLDGPGSVAGDPSGSPTQAAADQLGIGDQAAGNGPGSAPQSRPTP